MASVTSLTKSKIEELMAGWEAVGYSQDEINGLVVQLKNIVEANAFAMVEFQEVVLPDIQAEVQASAQKISELNDTTLPQLERDLGGTNLKLDQLTDVIVPNLRYDVDQTVMVTRERPKVYVQDDAPTNPDADDRYLVNGDTWFKSNENNRQRIWNGVEWSTFKIDVAEFSLTAKNFMSSRHQIL